MLRVIHQMDGRSEAWDLFVAGAAKKNESFDKYARRIGAEARTPETSEAAAADKARAIGSVKSKLGRFYRPPIKA